MILSIICTVSMALLSDLVKHMVPCSVLILNSSPRLGVYTVTPYVQRHLFIDAVIAMGIADC